MFCFLVADRIVAELVVKTDPNHQLCATLTVKVQSTKSVYKYITFDHQLPIEITA